MKNFLIAIALFSFSAASAQNFTPVDEGSKIHFTINNFGIATGGDISGMKGKITFDAKKPEAAAFDVTVDVATIDTDNDRRDGHLKRDDYFDAPKYPTIRLVSTKIAPGADLKNFIFKGNLTIRDITKPIEFPFTAEGKNGGALFAGSFSINRNDFGIGKESATMADKVEITLSAFTKAN